MGGVREGVDAGVCPAGDGQRHVAERAKLPHCVLKRRREREREGGIERDLQINVVPINCL